MEEFATSIFKENEIKTNNARVVKERPYYIGLLISMIGFILYLFDSKFTIYFLIIGYLIVIIGQIVMSGKIPSIGSRPLNLKLRNDSIIIGNDKLEIKDKNDIEIRIIGYKGQWINQKVALYQFHNGNENQLKIKYNDKETELKFLLDSESHKDKLVRFCSENGYKLIF